VANKAHAFRDRDVRRLVKAARAAGLNPMAIEVDIKASRIRVIDSKHDEAMSPLDRWVEEHRGENSAEGR
jgi:hypothetical protein